MIDVKIVEGCEVSIMPDPNSFQEFPGIVEKIFPPDDFDVMVDGTLRRIHIEQISQFTFGGVWMPNRRFVDHEDIW